ncbi:MAG: bifunctional methylenetetrahydrofolate dehydrogenase/methenyltetrahydrofolate cyclohydrolase FolD [Kiritimatiellia bacterium]|jgi:methylenetetrahydrofolate dehydrogenase (NADP+)/methenyltetrahydrofolate cyclohydrolase
MLINGLEISAAIRAECAAAAAQLAAAGNTPGLAVILVGEDPASVSYVTAKERACKETGIRSFVLRLPADTPQSRLLAEIRRLNGDAAVHGILVQLPLPRRIDESEVIRMIVPEKDVDGFHPVSLGKLVLGEDTFVSCTPAGIVEMLKRSGVETAGRHVVVVGRSNIVGKPVANLLLQKSANATVTVCHTGTRDLGTFTRQADILIVAAGRPGTVTADMVKPGAVVIDVGVNRVPDASKKSGFRLVGDTDFAGVSAVASRITPVPGGVGPMTIAMLLSNTIKAARQAAGF